MNRARILSFPLVLPLLLASMAAWACSPAGPAAGEHEGGDGDQASGGGALTGGANGSGGSGGTPPGAGGTGNPPTGGSGGAADGSSGGGPNGAGGTSTGGALGTGGTGPEGSGCESADIFCLDFEADAVGSEPAHDWDASVVCYDQGYSRTVEATVGLDGSQGFVTAGASSSANTCALVYDLGDLADFWVTAHIKITGTNPDMEHEVTFFELGELANVDDPELRIGYRGDSSCPNAGAIYQGFELGATKGASGGEDTGCTGSKVNDGIPVADEWYCLEVHVTQGSAMLTADMWVNGVNQDFLQHSQPVTEIRGSFEAHYLKVGQQSYAGSFAQLVLDNVSLSTSQVGCAL